MATMARQPVAAAHTGQRIHAQLQASSRPAVAPGRTRCQATSISTLIGNGAVQEVLLLLMEHSEAGAAPVAVSVHLPNSPATLPARATYDALAEAGAKKTLLPALTIFLSSTMAGCYIAFGGLLSTVVQAGLQSLVPTLPGLVKLVGGLVFPIGLTLVTLSGVELYTGNSGAVSMAVYQKKADVRGLMHNWFWSYTGNFVGSLLMVAAVHTSGVLEGNNVVISVAEAKSGLTFMQAFVRGVLANWLVCMAVWNTFAATSVPGKIISLWPCIASFVTLGLEHSVANMYLIPMGIALGAKVTLSQFMLHNLLPVTLGNTVAGAVVFAGGFSFLYGSLGHQLLGGGLLAQ